MKRNKSEPTFDIHMAADVPEIVANALQSAPDEDIIKGEDIVIGCSLGAKAQNYNVQLPDGSYVKLSEGTRITHVEVMAGKGKNRKIDEVVSLIEIFGGSESEWMKKKGIGYLDLGGESYKAELHWYEEVTIGRVRFKVKLKNGEWIIDD